MTVAGLRELHEHEYVSVWVYRSTHTTGVDGSEASEISAEDSAYNIYQNSAGFHGCLLNTNVGFSATKGGALAVNAVGWTEVTGSAQDYAWSTSDYPSLFEIALPNHAACVLDRVVHLPQPFDSNMLTPPGSVMGACRTLDMATGRFTAPAEGIYFASAIIRLDGATSNESSAVGWFSVRAPCLCPMPVCGVQASLLDPHTQLIGTALLRGAALLRHRDDDVML